MIPKLYDTKALAEDGGASNYEIFQGTTSLCYLKINGTSGATFDNQPKLTSDDSSITFGNIVRLSDTILSCIITTGSTTKVGDHNILISNEDYSASTTAVLKVVSSPYNRLSDNGVNISSTGLYQNDGSIKDGHIFPGDTKLVEFEINNTSVYFEEDCEVTLINTEGIAVSKVVREINKNKLLVTFNVNKNIKTIGDHIVRFRNKTYNSLSTTTIKVDSFDNYNNMANYFSPSITAPAVDPGYGYKFYRGESKEIEVRGENFSSSATFKSNSNDIVFSNIVIVSSEIARMRVTVSEDIDIDINHDKFMLTVTNNDWIGEDGGSVSSTVNDYFYIVMQHDLEGISPSSLAPGAEYNFYLNGSNFLPGTTFYIMIDGKVVHNSTNTILDASKVSEYIIFRSSSCTSEKQIACSISVGTGVASGVHDVGVYFEDIDSTSTLKGAINIPSPPIIDLVANTVSQGDTNKDVVIQGRNFDLEAQVVVSGSGITISSTIVTSENSITFRCDVEQSAEVTNREVKVLNGTGLSSTGTLRVIAAPTIETCTPASVITGTSRTIEIKGKSFGKHFRLEFSGHYYIDLSTYTANEQRVIINSGSEKNIYLLGASYTGDTSITAEVYFGSEVISGSYDILVINYVDEEKTSEAAKGNGAGVLTVRQPLSILNEEETVPVGYVGKVITLKGTGFSSDTKVTMLDSGVDLKTDQMEVINDKEINITIDVSSDSNIGKKRLQVKDDVTGSSYKKDFIRVISPVLISDVQPEVLPLGVRVATVTIQGSYFDIDYDTTSIVSFEGVSGASIANNSVLISGDGIDNLCLDTSTYNSSYIQLYMSVVSTATVGIRSLTIINKDGENEISKDSAFVVGEVVEIESMQPNTFKVGSNSGDIAFVITGKNFNIDDSDDKDIVSNYLEFTNNTNLEFTKIKSHTDTEIQGEFNWKATSGYNSIGNRNVGIKVINKDGSIGTLQNALILSEPLSIESINPLVIPVGAKDLVITVKGRGFLDNIEAKFYKDSLDESVADEVRDKIKVKDIVVTSNELTLKVDTAEDLAVLDAMSGIKLYLKNTGGDFINTTDSSGSLYFPFYTGNYPTIYSVEPNNVRVKGKLDNIELSGRNLGGVTSISFSNNLEFVERTRTDDKITGSLYATNAYSGNVTIHLSTSNVVGDMTLLPNKGKFTVNPSPSIDSVNPGVFYKGISSVLSISGSNFDTDAVGNGVKVMIERQDKNPLASIDVSTSNINTNSNRVVINNLKFMYEGKYNIKVTNPDGSYILLENVIECKTANSAATVTSLNPSFGKLGATADVYVEGTNFMEGMSIYSRGGGLTISTYTIYTSSATFSMTINADANLGSNSIVFANPNAEAMDVTFYVVDNPTVSKATPISLVQGSTNVVTITGTNFLDVAREFSGDLEYIDAKISGDGIKYMKVEDVDETNTEYNGTTNIRIKVYVDELATKGPRDILVTNPFSLQGLGASLIKVVEPIVFSSMTVMPNIIAQGNSNKTVVINGRGFEDGVSVDFTGYGVKAESTKFISSTTIEVVVTVDEGAESGYRGMIVTNSDAEPVLVENVLLVGDGIGVERVEPGKIGRGAEERELEIIGRDFGESTGTIKISGTGITIGDIVSWSDKLIKVKVTIGKEASVGSRNVTVIRSEGSSGRGDGVLEIVDSVVIDKMVPESITQGTSVSVVIEGSGFTESSDIGLEISDGEGIDISNITVSGDTNLLFDVYVSTYTNTGAHDIKVMTKNGYGVGKGKFVVDEFLSLSGVSPNKISRGVSGREIYVYGTGFTEDSNLSIEGGGVTINKVYYQNSKLLKAVVTVSLDASLGDREVVVKNSNDTSVSMTGILAVVKEVRVDSVKPERLGIGVNGVEVKIKGAEFKAGAELSFSNTDIEVTTYTVDSSSLITAVLRVLDTVNEGNYRVRVTNLDGNYGENNGGITIYEKVKIESVVGLDDGADYFVIPSGGGIINKTLKIKGSGFEEGENGEVPEVTFSISGIVVRNVYFSSQNEITCDVSIDCSNIMAGSITDVSVRNIDGTVGTGVGVYSAMERLELTKISPKRLSQGAKNISFYISGKGFVEDGLKVGFYSPHTDTVVLDDISYQSSALLELHLSVLSEAQANIPVNFYVENKNGDIVFSSDVFRGDQSLQINDAPVIMEVEPSSLQQGSVGQILKIKGTSFFPDGWKETIISDIKGIEIDTFTFTNTEIDMLVNVKKNAEIGSRNIEVTTIRANNEAGGADIEATGVGEGLFSITTLPVVTSVSSKLLYLDREYNDFTIRGDGFSEASKVEFSDKGIVIERIKINSQKSMTMDLLISTASSVGQVDITIDNQNGSVGMSKGIFEIMEQPIPPSFTNISMMYLPIKQKNRVKVTGSNLQEGIIADFRANFGTDASDKGKIVVSSLVWISANEFDMDIEVGEEVLPGKYNLVLTNPDGGVLVYKNAIEVIGAASIEKVDPNIIIKDILGDRVVNIVIIGNNFSDKIDPTTIKVNDGEIKVIEGSFKFISTKEFRVDILITTSTVVGMKSVEFTDAGTSYYGRIKEGLEIREEVIPKVNEILPELVMRDKREAELLVRGENFKEGIQVESRISGIKVTTITYHSQNEILVGVSITDTEVGGYSLFFRNPYSREVEVEDAVKVLAYPTIEKVEPSEIVVDGDRVVHLVVSGKDFYKGMDPGKILISGGKSMIVDTTTFRYNGRTNISFDVLVSGDVDEGDYDIELDNLSGINGIGKGLIKVVYDTSNLIRNVSISSGKILTDKGESSRVYFYFSLTTSCKVELLVYLSTEPLTYSEAHKVQEIDYLTADTYGRDNCKLYWDGKYPMTDRKINGSYNFIIRATSKSDGTSKDYYITKDTKKLSKLSETSDEGSNGAGAVELDAYNISDSVEVIYNKGFSEGDRVDGNIYPYTIHYILSKACKVKLTITEKETGLVFKTAVIASTKDDNYFDWDGRGDNGERINKGTYEVKIEGTDISNEEEKPEVKTVMMSSINIDMDINERRRYFEKNTYPYPNPVNINKHRTVKFSFWMEKEGSVNCYIYDTLGQLVWKGEKYSSEGRTSSDYMEWDLRGRSGKKISRGLYIMVMEAKEKGTGDMLKVTKKMMVIK